MPLSRRLTAPSGAALVALVALVSGSALLGAPRSTARAAPRPQDRRLISTRYGLQIEAPAGWSLSQHTGFAETVALLLHPDGSRISVTDSKTTARDAADAFEHDRPGLLARGLAPTRAPSAPAGWVAVDLAGKPRPGHDHVDKVRQLYLVRDIPGGRQLVVLTLVCREASFNAAAPALDFVATRLSLQEPAKPAGLAIDTPTIGIGGASGHGGATAGAGDGSGAGGGAGALGR